MSKFIFPCIISAIISAHICNIYFSVKMSENWRITREFQESAISAQNKALEIMNKHNLDNGDENESV